MSDQVNETSDDDRSEQLDQDQLQPGYSLNDRGVADALDEGYSPPEKLLGRCSARVSTRRWTQRLAEEEPEPDPYAEPEPETNLTVRDELENIDDGEVGDVRAGRLVDPNEGIGPDVDKDLVGERRRDRRRPRPVPRRPPCTSSPTTSTDPAWLRTDSTPVSADRAVRARPARRRRRSADLLGGVRQSGG